MLANDRAECAHQTMPSTSVCVFVCLCFCCAFIHCFYSNNGESTSFEYYINSAFVYRIACARGGCWLRFFHGQCGTIWLRQFFFFFLLVASLPLVPLMLFFHKSDLAWLRRWSATNYAEQLAGHGPGNISFIWIWVRDQRQATTIASV